MTLLEQLPLRCHTDEFDVAVARFLCSLWGEHFNSRRQPPQVDSIAPLTRASVRPRVWRPAERVEGLRPVAVRAAPKISKKGRARRRLGFPREGTVFGLRR